MTTPNESRLPDEPHGVTGIASADMLICALASARLPMLLTDPNQPDNPIVFANDAFTKLTGYDLLETLGRNCRFLQGPATDATSQQTLSGAVKARQEVSIQLLNYRKDGSSFWNALHISPVHGADGELLYFFACQFDVSQWHAAEPGVTQAQKMQIFSQLVLNGDPETGGLPSPSDAPIAALQRWREMERFAFEAESNLSRRDIAHSRGLASAPLGAERLLVAQLRGAAAKARAEAFRTFGTDDSP